MKDINKANFMTFKRYVFSLFKEESKKNSCKESFDKISIVEVFLEGSSWYSASFTIGLENSNNQFSRISFSNDFLKDWLCDLGHTQVDTENLKESWNTIILDTFFKCIEGLVDFE